MSIISQVNSLVIIVSIVFFVPACDTSGKAVVDAGRIDCQKDADCPADMLCHSRSCVFGGGGIDAELIVEEQAGVVLISSDENNGLYWATAGLGGCIRRLDNGSVKDLACVEGAEISGLTYSNGYVYWLADAPESAQGDKLYAMPARSTSTPPLAIDSELDVASIRERGPSLLGSAHDVSGVYSIAYVAQKDAIEAVRRLVINGHIVSDTCNFDHGFIGHGPAAIAITDVDLYFATKGAYARVLFRNSHVLLSDGSYNIISDDSEQNLQGFPVGQAWTSAVNGSDAWFSIRGSSDAGAILHSDGTLLDYLVVNLLLPQVDPESASKYAAGLASDGSYLYYVTAGGGSSSNGLFRLDLLGANAVPERILDLDATPGMLLLTTDGYLVWSEPENGRVMRCAKPAL